MLVILRENVENLGHTGEVVKVSDGYARNFLLPRKLVMVASSSNIKELEHAKKAMEKRRLAQRGDAEKLAEQLAGYSCTIARKVGANDKLFGSVSTADIADSLQKAGFKIDRRALQLKEPLKELGVHEVSVKLPPDVVGKVKVWIVKEE